MSSGGGGGIIVLKFLAIFGLDLHGCCAMTVDRVCVLTVLSKLD